MESDEQVNAVYVDEEEPICSRTSNIPEEHICKMKKEYHALDVDGDGDISRSELILLLKSMKRKLGMSDKAITKLVSQTDLDGDGTIDFNEFLHLVENVETKRVLHKALIQRAGIRKAFEKYDRDKKGFLTRPEFQKALEDKYEAVLIPKQVDAMMDQVDSDKSGRIEFEEFIKTFSYFPQS